MNAPVLARDRGLEFAEVKSPGDSDYTNLLTVRAGNVSVSGTLVGARDEERLVEIDGVLAAHEINIATMQVGRREQGGEAIMGVSVDSAIVPEVFEEMKRTAEIESGRFVELGG